MEFEFFDNMRVVRGVDQVTFEPCLLVSFRIPLKISDNEKIDEDDLGGYLVDAIKAKIAELDNN